MINFKSDFMRPVDHGRSWGWKKMRVAITLACEECKRRNYRSTKNKKQTDRLSIKKYCKFCHQHTQHKETR